jgi:hypothetical protein
VKQAVHSFLSGEETPTRALARALVPAPRQGVGRVRGVESYLRFRRVDRLMRVRVDVRGLMRLRLCVDDAS